ATLVLPAALRGRITIVDKTGRVTVELTKEAGEPLSLALPNETYSLHVDNGNGEFVATVTLEHGGQLAFDPGGRRRTAPGGTGAEPRENEDGDDEVRDTEARDTEARDTEDKAEDKAEHSGDGKHHHHHGRHSPWYRQIGASFGEGLRVERPQAMTNLAMPV